MSTYRASHFTDFSGSCPEDEVQLVSERVSALPNMEDQHQNVTSKQQQTVTSNERIVHEIKTRSVPTCVDLSSQPDLYPLRLTSMPTEPVTVRWDSVTPNAVRPERSLQRMDQELQRLAGDMKRLWGQSSLFGASQPHDLSRVWNQPSAYGDPDLQRLLNQANLDREAELQRLWNQPVAYRSAGSMSAAPACLEATPRGFIRLTPASSSSLVPRLDAPWGHDAHAEAWRKKENFLIDNPVVKGSDGNNQFCLEFDLRQFNAGEMEVTTDGHLLTVQAKHEESNNGKQVRREYFRQCTIPQDVEPKSITSQLSPSGILSVCAPVQAGVRDIVKSIDIKPV